MADSSRSPIGGWLPLAAAALLMIQVVMLPPEIDPRGRIGAFVLAAVAMTWLAVRCSGGLPRWTCLLLPLAALALLRASCRARAADEAAAVALLLVAGLLGRRLAAEPGSRRFLLALLVVLATGAAARGAIQHHVTYPRLAAELRAAGPADPTGLRGRVESGRPAGPFSLPAALGGFLGLSLPAALAAVARSRRGGIRLAAAVMAALQGYTLLLCQSIGGLLAAAAGIALVLPLLSPRRPGRALAGLLLVAAGAAALFTLSRPEISEASETGPLALRAGNWQAAARMILDHPLAGTGPGSFGTAYTRYRRPGMNETDYAHDSYLQAAASWGVWVAMPLGALLWALAAAVGRSWRERDAERLPALGAAAGFLLHNLLDFTAYLPGIAVPASLLLGLGLGRREEPPGQEPPSGEARRPWTAGVAALLAAALAAHGVASGRSALLLDDAVAAAGDGQVEQGAALARRAAAARPGDPAPHAFLAQLILHERMQDPRLRAEGQAAAEIALRLDPESAILHYTRALYHQAAGEKAAAYRERYAAHRLYPLKPLYAPERMVREERP